MLNKTFLLYLFCNKVELSSKFPLFVDLSQPPRQIIPVFETLPLWRQKFRVFESWNQQFPIIIPVPVLSHLVDILVVIVKCPWQPVIKHFMYKKRTI